MPRNKPTLPFACRQIHQHATKAHRSDKSLLGLRFRVFCALILPRMVVYISLNMIYLFIS